MKAVSELDRAAPLIQEAPDFAVSKSLADKITLAWVIVPTLLALPLGLLAYATVGISTLDIALFFAMSVVSELGIGAGFHRYFTHNSFKTIPVMEWILGVSGTFAAGSPLIWWVALHRRHHQFTEQAQDPHSPLGMGSGITGLVKGFLHSHCTWFFSNEYHGMKGLYYIAKYTPDLMRNNRVVLMSKQHNLIVGLGLVIPACIGGLIGGTPTAALTGLVWGGVIRLAAMHHTEFLVNSFSHMFGGRSYPTNDNSRNNIFVALISGGEGWHNNHHAFPYSARHGFKWWQLDTCFLFLLFLEKCSLIWDVRRPASSS